MTEGDTLRIAGGEVLLRDELRQADLFIADGRIAGGGRAGAVLDARGLLVLPGIIDMHGDAFERQIQPRPGISFPARLALADTEAQLLSNGITTAYHGVTLSWEPGLRSLEAWTAWLDALETARPRMACDMRVHLRWEAYNLPALETALADILSGRVHLVAFNDHTPSILRKLSDPVKGAKFAERAEMTMDAFRALAEEIAANAGGVAEAQDRIAAAARASGLPMASHDDDSIATRDAFRARGAHICEFPMAEEVGSAARREGDFVVMGAPNVVRGGSHIGWASAARLAEAGICNVLASDYYYPALFHAPFLLAARGVLSFAEAWALVSANPAAACLLHDRGSIAPGMRADLVLAEAGEAPRPVATIANGKVAWLAPDAAARLRVDSRHTVPA